MDRTLWLIECAHQGDKKAREAAVEENMGLVMHVVKRYQGKTTDMEDLIQIGCIGLLKAVDYFDLNMDVRFSSYAVPMILGEIRRYLRDDGIAEGQQISEKYRISDIKDQGNADGTAGKRTIHRGDRRRNRSGKRRNYHGLWKPLQNWNPFKNLYISQMEMKSVWKIRWKTGEMPSVN